MLMYDEQTNEYFDTDKVDAIISAFVLAYAPKQAIFDVVAEILEESNDNAVPLEQLCYLP